MQFDQLNEEFKANIPKGKGKWRIFLPKLRREKVFLQLINKHNFLALEINKCNLLLRRTTAIFFVVFSLVKITTLYLAIHVKHILTRIIVNIFSLVFIFGFGLSILFALQIKSSKNSYKIINLLICKYKMKLKFRLKVNKYKNKINLN